LAALLLCCAALHAGLEPVDEGLLLRYTSGDAILPGVMPVGFEHVFEPGDLQETEVLDRGVYRTLRYHIVARLDDKVICEAHNGRGLVFAGLMDKNGTYHKAWAGRSGERPVEIKHRTNFHMQTMLHEALRVPWPQTLYNAPARGYREGETYRLGETTLTVRAATYVCSGVTYECLQSHGADNWFGPYWQWSADGVVLMRVTRREKLAAAQPLLDWSKIAPGTPTPIDPPGWEAPSDDWSVQARPDGSTLVFSYNAAGEYRFLDTALNPVSGSERITPYGRGAVDATSPGPFVVPAGCTLQLQPPIDTEWAELDLLLRQAVKLPISMVVVTGPAAQDRGLQLLKDLPQLQSLDAFLLSQTISAKGFASIAAMSKLTELSFTFANEAAYAAIGPLKALKQVRKLALRAPDLSAIPGALLGWSNLEQLEFTGKDRAA
jgi:hypothetical protein